MKIYFSAIIAAVVAIVLFISGCSSTEEIPVSDDMDKLQGTWVGKELGRQGVVKIIFSDNIIDFKGARPQNCYKGSVVLNQILSPKQIDFTILLCTSPVYAGKISKGIYKFEDDTLVLSCSEPGNETRPNSFDLSGENRVFKLTLQSLSNEKVKIKHFLYQLKEYGVEIQIPEIPFMILKEHPFHKEKPHLLYAGSKQHYNISIIAPTVDSGMTSSEYATSTASLIVKRYGFSKEQVVLYKQQDSDCISMFYYLKIGSMIQLNAHLFSMSAQGTHGIEVRISRLDSDSSNIDNWMKGFPLAAIKILK